MSEVFNPNRIARNSIFLYLRMLITMWFNLWATRLVLTNLGIDDMGVYNVVGSIVGLFSVLAGGVTTAVQRFISFELGKENGRVGDVFCTSLNIIFIFSALIFVILESAGLWFLYYGANIPAQSMNAAFWVFQLSVLTCIIGLVSIPYNSLIIAHERMNAYAIICIIQVALNWASAFGIVFFIQSERMFLYALFIAIANIITRAIYQIYCRCKFKESEYHLCLKKNLIMEIGRFTGITTASTIIQTITSQSIVIILNVTFGVGINAVYQIAIQLKNAILSFSLNVCRAITPQITKTYANGEMERHKKLVYSGSKIELFMILFILMPFVFRADYIMGLWLGDVPKYATSFAMFMLLLSLIYAGFEPIRSAVLATGKIYSFSIYPEIFFLAAVVLGACMINSFGKAPVAMIATFTGLEIITCAIRLLIAKRHTFLSLTALMRKVILPVSVVMAISAITCYSVTLITSTTIIGMIVLLAIHSTILLLAIYFIGCTKTEKEMILQISKKMFAKQ